MSKRSRRSTNERRSKKKTTQLELALTQASNDLTDSLSMRRTIDTKIYGLIALSSAIAPLLIAAKPWSNKGFVGTSFFVLTIVTYFIIVGLGLWQYYPAESSIPNSRAILDFLDKPYEELMRWTTNDLLDFADNNYEVVRKKSSILAIMLRLFLIAVVFLVLGTLLY